jgi:4-hydroxybenzoate polyprenyltransferase
VTLVERLSLYEKLMRLDRPIGILLLLWPALWALWLSAPGGRLRLDVLIIFVLGTVLMRSAGCVMNDYADRNFDRHVERTRERPLTAGKVTTREALALAGVLSLLAFGLVLMLNTLTILLSFAALFLAASYPFTKRFFPLPQAYLGVAFGFSIPMAYAAQQDTVPGVAWVLLLANVFWAIAYDTEYAMVDRNDDIKLGLRSSAILFGDWDVAAVMACHAVFIGLLAGVGYWLGLGVLFYVGLVLASGFMLAQYQLIHKRQRERCFAAFLNNNWVGAVVFAGIAADRAYWVRLI